MHPVYERPQKGKSINVCVSAVMNQWKKENTTYEENACRSERPSTEL